MKTKFKSLWIMLSILLIASLAFAACAGPEPVVEEEAAPAEAEKEMADEQVTIAFSGFAMTNEFWLTLERAAEARAEELGIDFLNLTLEVQDAEAQKNAVDSAITQGVDAIIIGAADSRGWEDTLDKAEAAGIPVVTVDTAIDDPYVSALIQTDNLAAAGIAGDYLCEQTGGEGTIFVLGGSVGHQTGDARKDGVAEKAAACGLEVISDYSDWDENRSAELTSNTLTAYPDLKAVFVAFDPGAAAAMQEVLLKGMQDQVMVVGFDALPVALKSIAAGEMSATVRQDPAKMGATGVDLALSIIGGEEVETFIPIDGVLITADNVAEFYTPEEAEAEEEMADEQVTIAFSGFAMTNEFWLTLERAAEARAEELGIDFLNLTLEVQDAEAQKNAVDSAITQGVDAIIIGAADSRGWEDTLDKAEAAGIPVVTVDTAIDDPYVSALIQTDNLAAAGIAGDYLCEQTGGEGTIFVLGGSVGHQTGDARKDGVAEKAAACGLEVISDYSDWDENRSAELTSNTLTAYPELKAVFVAFDPGAAAAMQEVLLKGMQDQVMVVGFDALPVALKSIAAGEMSATVRQDPAKMGATGVDLALSIIGGEEVETFIPIDGVLITADNVAEYLSE
jgi:ABC-type sugar transport system substrate-binding protein